MSNVPQNLKNLLGEIEGVSKEKNVNVPKLIAVSKTFEYDKIQEAYLEGQRDFGENRVQELEIKNKKSEDEKHQIDFHFIGSLQSNKIKKLIIMNHLLYIHSIENQKQVELISNLVQRIEGKKVKVFLQVNSSFETEKGGVDNREELFRLWDFSKEQEKKTKGDFSVTGLMTIGKIRTDNFVSDAHKSFQLMKDYQKSIQDRFKDSVKLSMGMSSDFKIAIEYGADYLRIGSRIFGER